MAGRHSKRAEDARVRVPAQRASRLVAVTDARTHVEHLVSQESVVAHRLSGRYSAVCGIEVLPASLTEPGRAGMRPVSGLPCAGSDRAESGIDRAGRYRRRGL